jgi:prepilin-type N-terminal cleavage/methylation domain-containing protein
MRDILRRKSGFTLIEMIGVIAIIAILTAFVAPKVVSVIRDSSVTRFASEVPVYATAATNWLKDIGDLRSLNAAGAVVTNDASFQVELIASQGTAGLWANWDGPYIDSVASPAIGTALTISSYAGAAGTAAPGAAALNAFDLDDNAANEMSGKQVVALTLTGVTSAQQLKIDSIIDKGLTVARRATSGKVKYSGTQLVIYLTSG